MNLAHNLRQANDAAQCATIVSAVWGTFIAADDTTERPAEYAAVESALLRAVESAQFSFFVSAHDAAFVTAFKRSELIGQNDRTGSDSALMKEI